MVSEDTNIADPVGIVPYVIADFPHSQREFWPALAEDTRFFLLVRENHEIVKVHAAVRLGAVGSAVPVDVAIVGRRRGVNSFPRNRTEKFTSKFLRSLPNG